jgi:hypothetical protein
MKCIVLLPITAMILSGCAGDTMNEAPGTPQAAGNPVMISKSVVGGERSKLNFSTALNPDCTAAGHVGARIRSAPSHGSVSIREDTDFTNFQPTNQRYPCNRKQSPGTVAFYQPDPSFIGTDRAVIDYTYPNGEAETVTFNITVR